MLDITKIQPKRSLVTVKLLNLNEIYESLITQDQSSEDVIAVRYGKVISMGPEVDTKQNCKDLKANEIALFTEFAGYYIPTTENICKIIRGYDIIGKTTDVNDFNKLTPTSDRVLIETVDISKMSSNVILENASDPKLADLKYGKVIKVGPELTDTKLKKGQLVAYAPYTGTIVRHYESEKKQELSIIVEEDILFTT